MTENKKRQLSWLLVLVMLFSMEPATVFADNGEPLAVSFACDETVAYVTVHDANGEVMAVGEDGRHHLVPGSYYYSAEADGFEAQTMQPFTIPADAVGDQQLKITMTPVSTNPEEQQNPQTPQEPGTAEDQPERIGGGIFDARYSKYQAFHVYRAPAFPTGSQEVPNPFAVTGLSAPAGLEELGEDDYFYFAALGQASRTGVAVSEMWYAEAENLDPYAVSLHVVREGADSELARGVIGAFSAEGFLFVAGDLGMWFSNTVGYTYDSADIAYTPVAGGRLVCDLALLTGCEVQSMLKPAADGSAHVHVWSVEAEGGTAVYRCVEEGCPYDGSEFTMTLSIPAFVPSGSSAEATLVKSAGEEDWPAELEQNIICYTGRGDTEYPKSMTPPSAEGTYMAEVRVGPRYLVSTLTADFAVAYQAPVPFEQTQSVNGIVVTVRAAAGAFPADAVLSVEGTAVDEAMEAAIAGQRSEGREKLESSAVKVNVADRDGNPLLPAGGRGMSVSLTLAEPVNENLEIQAYRMTEEGAAALAMNGNGGCTAEETGGVLRYVLELSCPVLRYSLVGNESVALSEVLEAVGLSGTVSQVEVGDPQVLYAYEKNGSWRLSALRSFTEIQSIRVTVGGLVYEIRVEDGDLSEACRNGHSWSPEYAYNPSYCTVCGELKAIAEGGSFDLEFNNDRWIVLGDPEADTENYLEWDRMFEDFSPTGNRAEDLLAVARSQIGYEESISNFAMNARRERNGYTRYGAWYGMPYAEWCAMFVCFCLHYAGIEDADFPYNSGCEAWYEKLSAAGLFAPAAEAGPKAGDVIFYDFDEDGVPEHVGIVNIVDAGSGVIYTIEGNYDDVVKTRETGLFSPYVFGYGVLPEDIENADYPAFTHHEEVDGMIVDIDAPAGAFPDGTTVSVKPVEAEQILDSVTDALDEGTTILQVKAVDISFFDADGNEIEPLRGIHVSLKDAIVEEAEGAQLVHVDSEGNACVVTQADEETAADEVSFVSDRFSTYAIIISTRVIAADGSSYRVELSYTDAARLSAGAYLTAEELAEDCEAYAGYYAAALEARNEAPAAARFFDITIHAPDGTPVEPAAPVQISIALDDAMSVGSDDLELSVLHYTGEKTETLKAESTVRAVKAAGEATESETESETVGETVVFDTASLSVYGVLTYNTMIQPENLDGRTLAITNGDASIPAETGGSTTDPLVTKRKWYVMQGVAASDSALASLSVDAELTSTKWYVTANAEISLWTFSYAGMSDDGNYLYTIQLANPPEGEGPLYLNLDSSGLRLGSEPQEIKLIPNASGVRFDAPTSTASHNYLSYSSSVFQRSANPGTGSVSVMNIIDLDETPPEGTPSYTATKYHSYDMQGVVGAYTGGEAIDDIIIYGNFYNPLSGKYELYVIDGEGNAIHAYDNGDSLSFYSEVSPVWHMTACTRDGTAEGELNGYYIFQNVETGLVLSPEPGSEHGIEEYESYTTSGVLLAGRENHETNSTIEKWSSDEHRDYGYHLVIEDGHVVVRPCSYVDSVPLSFARIMPPDVEPLHPVETVDSKSNGITIRMFDYGGRSGFSNASSRYSSTYVSKYFPSYSYQTSPRLNITSNTYQADSYPKFNANGNSAATIFGPGSEFYMGEGNHLFLASTYESTGYYSYSGFDNFAFWATHAGDNANNPPLLDEDGNVVPRGSVHDFTVYEEIASAGATGVTHKRGHFLPFNTLDPTRYSGQSETYAGNVNTYDNRLAPLDLEDPSLGGPIYQAGTGQASGDQPVNYFFGMTVECNFMQPHDGMVDGGPVQFEFTGDDDMWVYVDGVRLLDLGGVHSAMNGSINFATGVINNAGTTTTIKQRFQDAGVFPDGTPWDNSKVDDYFEGNTFKDYSSHSFKMFYMESGAGASNLVMRFNLPVVEEAQFTVEKELEDNVQPDYANVEFAYQAFYMEGEQPVPLIPGIHFGGHEEVVEVVYENTSNPVTFHNGVVLNGKNYDNVFYLKPGEAVTFKNIPEDEEYFVQEVGLPEGFCDHVYINDQEVQRDENGNYVSTVDTVNRRARVRFLNEVDSTKLLIHKVLAEGCVDNGDTFTFQILMENTAGTLVEYNEGPYYFKKGSDYYVFSEGQLVPYGEEPPPSPYTSSRYGLIESIPAGFTIEIPRLAVGTSFYVNEVRIPANWTLVSKELKAGSYDPSDLTGQAWDYEAGDYVTVTADGQTKVGTDAEVTLTNKWETVSVTAEKIWNDNDDEFGIRPGSVTIKLYKQVGSGEKTQVTSVELKGTADQPPSGSNPVGYEYDAWKAKFINLPKCGKDGTTVTEITYSVVEDPVPTGYSVIYDPSSGIPGENGTVKIKNTPETVPVTVKKIWDDNNNENGIRPGSIKVKLYKQIGTGTEILVEEVTLNDGNNWTKTWPVLPKYGKDTDNTVKIITYKVSEVDVPGYSVIYDPLSRIPGADGIVTITNTPFTPVTKQLEVTKKLTGREWESTDSFTFTLGAVDGAPMPASGGEIVTVTSTSINYSGVFGEIKYVKAETYSYTITESPGTLDGVTYDTNPHTAVVVVEEDTAANKLYVKSVVYDGDKASLVVENKFTPVTAQLEVTKELTGREWTTNDSFTFTLAAKTEGAPLPAEDSRSVTVTKDQRTGTFGTMSFRKEGDYTYTITETPGTLGGVTYDTTPHDVTVYVAKDQTTNQLSIAKIEYETEDGLTITNVYDADGKTHFEAKKELTGRKLEAGEFSFVLKDADGNTIETVQNDADGKVVFSELEYILSRDKDKLPIVYTIEEVPGSLPGVTYETGKLTVKVNFTDNGDGTLSVVPSYSDLPDQTFKNVYESEVEVPFEARKELVGRKLKAGEFKAQLLDAEGNVLQTVANDEDGVFTFDPLVFDQSIFETASGEYVETVEKTFMIREVDEGKSNIKYDKRTYIATLTLTDNGDGTISYVLVWTVDDSETEEVVFTNKYNPPYSPGTGDGTNIWPWLGALILSGCALVTDTILSRRKKNRAERRGS